MASDRCGSPAFRQECAVLAIRSTWSIPAIGRGVRHAVPQLERPIAHLGGTRVRETRDAEMHRVDRGREGTFDVVTLHPLVRDEHGAADAPGPGLLQLLAPGQRLGVPHVQSRALAGKQLFDDRVAHERVPESVATALHDDDDTGVDARAQSVLEFIGRSGHDLFEQLVVDPPASGSERTHDVLRVLVQGLVAGEEDLTQGLGHHDRVGIIVDADQFLDEEGHPFTAFEERGAAPGTGRRSPAGPTPARAPARQSADSGSSGRPGDCARARPGTLEADVPGRRRRCGSSARS